MSNDDKPQSPFEQAIEGLDMRSIDGITCEIVHPILTEAQLRVADMATSEIARALPAFQAQLVECLSYDIASVLSDAANDGYARLNTNEDESLSITFPYDFLVLMFKRVITFSFFAANHINHRLNAGDETFMAPRDFYQMMTLLGAVFMAQEPEKNGERLAECVAIMSKWAILEGVDLDDDGGEDNDENPKPATQDGQETIPN